ncbi:hypothetical protein [Streptomyces mobaraensis]|uniref:hypothetical protein n=1 Tax=Streptomyces mobaraensis TaxID=35621 RepID=UPI0012647BE3|nr:hypothetical protein [Streptomyces mobaraensis]
MASTDEPVGAQQAGKERRQVRRQVREPLGRRSVIAEGPLKEVVRALGVGIRDELLVPDQVLADLPQDVADPLRR